MANSLIDFGGLVQQSQNQLQNMIAMYNMGIHEDRANSYEQQIDLQRQNLELQKQNAEQTALMNLHKLMNDPVIQRTPGAVEQIGDQIGKITGAPAISLSNIQVGKQNYQNYLSGLASGDAEKAKGGLIGIALTTTPDDLNKIVNATSNMQETSEKIAKAVQWRQANAAKVEDLQNKNALVNIAKPAYTATASAFRDDLKGTDSASFKQLQDLYAKNPSSNLLGSANKAVNKQAFPQLLDGRMANKALAADQQANALFAKVDQAQKMLDDSEHGVPLPKDVTPAMLRASIETNSTLAGAYRSMKDWYEYPLDKDKLAVAKAAYGTIESRRIDMEGLDKTVQAETAKARQDALTFRMSEAEQKHAYDSALADAQGQFAALPAAQQTPQAASKIFQSVKDSTGVAVKPEDIMKGIANPNKPLVENKIDLAGKAEQAYATEFNQQMARKDVELHDLAQKAPETFDRAARIINTLQNSKTITGIGADFRLNVAKAMKLAGLSDSDAPENTEALFTDLASNTLDAVKASGLGAGTGFSNTDREYLEKAKGGKITLEKESMLRIARITQNAQRLIVNRWNQRVKQLPESAIGPSGISREPIQLSSSPQAKPSQQAAPQQPNAAPAPPAEVPTIRSDADFKKLPSGAIFIGPDGKKRRKP